MKTDKRINNIVEAANNIIAKFDNNVVVADIATDHGYIAEKLSLNDKVEKVIATDISVKCLQKTIDLIKKKNIKKVETALGDGLNPIETADICVIAGIGGYEIINMLKNQNTKHNKEVKCRYFVLQPAQNEYELRHWIFDNKVRLICDYIVEDAERFYPILVIDILQNERNKKSVFNLRLGRDNKLNNNEFVNYMLMLKENMLFFETLKIKRVKKDKALYEKYKLYVLIEKLLKRCYSK